MALKTKPLSKPVPLSTPLTSDAAALGPPVTPFERLQLMSSATFENLVCEWVGALGQYARIEQLAGSGDSGLDVVGFASPTEEDPWDLFQCKHYDHPLSPSEFWLELGKLVFYTFSGEYSVPRRYHLVASQGVGPSLSKLLRKPDELRALLLAAWDSKCCKKITSTREILLETALKSHIDNFDFRIVTAVSPHTIITDLRKLPVYPTYFGGGLSERPPVPNPPSTLTAHETNYVRALLDAYEDRLGTTLGSLQDLHGNDLVNHFTRSRCEFYSAESLREFSRDNVQPGTFDSLLDEMHSGVVDVVQAQHPNAFERVLAVVKQAKAMQFTANALGVRTYAADKGGMCHQLANDHTLRWRP